MKPPNRNIISFYLNNAEFEQLKIVAAIEQKSIHGYVKDLVYTRINKICLTKGPSKQEIIRAQQELLENYLTALLDIQQLAATILEEKDDD